MKSAEKVPEEILEDSDVALKEKKSTKIKKANHAKISKTEAAV
ncbi:MAG TPA: hypothetical protein V6C97_21345 [Oculatellaceae cyanobacterium]